MVKDKVFWTELCETHNYRFFSGVPFGAVSALYNGMDSKVMHYIPAANENIALQMAAGVRVGGIKSGVIIDSNLIESVDLSFLDAFSIPMFFITTKFKRKDIFSSINLQEVVHYVDTTGQIGAFLYEEIYSS